MNESSRTFQFDFSFKLQKTFFMENKNTKIAILGGGSWATAIAKIILQNVDKIYWYMRRQEQINEFIQLNRNPFYLTGARFDTKRIHFNNDINHVIEHADILIFAIPSPYLEDHLKKLDVSLENKVIISAIKGIIPNKNLIISDFFETKYKINKENIAIVSGPCHAEEVALERLSYLTIASVSSELTKVLNTIFSTDFINIATSNDIAGIEYSAIMKNIYAVMSGISHGLKYGDNFQAVLISNAIQEIDRFCNAIHPFSRNINQTAYLGDLLGTAYSQFSRNRLFGNMIGKGYSIRAAKIELGMIAEGYYATKCICEINKNYQVDLPIVNTAYDILYKNEIPAIKIKELSNQLV